MTLRLCSMAARGLWIEMLAIMGISDRYGYLQIGGKMITEEQLAVMAGCSLKECIKLMAELESNGVFRRMAREHIAYELAAANGKKGGNPILIRNQNLESRNHNLESTVDLSQGVKDTLKGHPSYTLQQCTDAAQSVGMTSKQIKEFFDHWNAIGWVDPHNRPIVCLSSALSRWKTQEGNFKKILSASKDLTPTHLPDQKEF
jgi:hypothetical protein